MDFFGLKSALDAQPLFAGKTWRLSPDAFRFSAEQRAQLDALGEALPAFFAALEKLYFASAENRKISLQIPDSLLANLALSTTNEEITLPALTVTGSISLSSNGGDISFEGLAVGDTLNLTVKNGDIAGTVMGSYDDFAIQSELKKGESNLPERKDGGEKTLNVSSNNGDVSIEFASE